MDWIKDLLGEDDGTARIKGPANPGELRVIAQLFDILIMCCMGGVDYPCKDGKGIQEYKEMKESLLDLANEMEGK